MTNKLEIIRELAQKVDDLLYIMTGHDSYPRLVHTYGKEWRTQINEMRAEVCTLLAAPVVERQDVQVSAMPVDRCYDVRVKMIMAFNEAKKNGGDLDDALDAAYKSALRFSPNPLLAEQPAPVAVVPLLAKGFATLESIGGKYKIVTGFENRDDAWAAYDELCRATSGIAKVKELIPTTAAASNNLRNFANAMIDIALEGGNADGAQIQELAVEHGLLKPEQRTERCGDTCSCAEYADFPVECFRKVKELNQ